MKGGINGRSTIFTAILNLVHQEMYSPEKNKESRRSMKTVSNVVTGAHV